MKFKALIDGVHFDPKKGAVKIVLVGASHVSLDELTTLSPKDETIQVTLESEQTKIKVFPLTPTGVAVEPGSREEKELEEGRNPTGANDPITLDEEAAAKLKEAADRLRQGGEEKKNSVNLRRKINGGQEI
jgi:hypothetical protein